MGRAEQGMIVLSLMLLDQGVTYEGVGFEGKICGVSILRAGEVCIIATNIVTILLLLWSRAGYGSRPP